MAKRQQLPRELRKMKIFESELYAILMALEHTRPQNCHLILHVDNCGAAYSLRKFRTRPGLGLKILSAIYALMSSLELSYTVLYINTKRNPSDDPSRGVAVSLPEGVGSAEKILPKHAFPLQAF